MLGEYEIDAVFHLAAQTIVGTRIATRSRRSRSNVARDVGGARGCRRSRRPTRIVVASSDKAYGEQPKLPYHEEPPLQGRHPYDVSKACADLIAQTYAVTSGCRS